MPNVALAHEVHTENLSASNKSAFRIIPAGRFKAQDGRPGANAYWVLTKEAALQIISAVGSLGCDYPIDYEHQTIGTVTNGAPAPAAGWFKRLEWRDDGLYVIDARWTDRAKGMIDKAEYRYISPVFTFNKETFAVQALHSLALTNKPALTDLTDLASLRGNGYSPPSIDYGGDRANETMANFIAQINGTYRGF